ncbi:MAG: ATP-binding protein [Lentisphaeraceae bacterium]|nr:ATP-binding protein [Lentisphaeraceae bacterium]
MPNDDKDVIVSSPKRKLFFFPLALFVICLIATSYIDFSYENKYHSQQIEYLQSREKEIALELDFVMRRELSAVERMGKRWENGLYTKETWDLDAIAYYNDHDNFQGIGWVDNTFHVRWIVPLKGNEKAVNLNLAFEENRRKALILARDKGTITVTAPINLVQGGKGFLVYLPLKKNGEFDGFISSVFRVDKLFDNFMAQYHESFDYEVRYDSQSIFKELKGDTYTLGFPVSILGEKWTLRINPKSEDFFFNPIQKFIYPLGFFVSLFIAGMALLMQYSRFKSDQLAEANNHLIANNKALDLAKKKSEEASKAKSSFLANMSHEIRTPLNGIIGATELAQNCDSLDDSREYNDIIHSSSHALLSIINDILDFSKIESGKFSVENTSTNIPELLKSVYGLMIHIAEEKSLYLQFDIEEDFPKYWLTDQTRLRQVLLNLLGNAIKFTEEGKITLEAKCAGDYVKFVVRDTGIGISNERQEVIFEEFEQADTSTTREFGGTGLGLAISKRLSEVLGGTLSLESELGKGSTFTVSLRLEKSVAPRVEEEVAIKLFNGEHVLLCEDNRTNQRIAKKVLNKLGLEVDVASDGEEGLKFYKEHNYSLILMDMQMPVMDGLQATKVIRAEDADIPIIALTANVTTEDNRLCEEAGMNAFLTKPLNSKLLYSELHKWLD